MSDGYDEEEERPSTNHRQVGDEAKANKEEDSNGEVGDEKDSWRDDDSLREYDERKDRLDPQEDYTEVARGVEKAAAKGVDEWTERGVGTAPAVEYVSIAMRGSSQATTAQGACNAQPEADRVLMAHVELKPELDETEMANKTAGLHACNRDELVSDQEPCNTDDLVVRADELGNEVGVLAEDFGREAGSTDDLAVEADKATSEGDVLADKLAEPARVAATALAAGRALALIDDESLAREAGEVVAPPSSLSGGARNLQESRGVVGAWENQRYEHRLLVTPATQKEPSCQPALQRGAVKHSSGRTPRRGGPSTSTADPKPVSLSKIPQFPPNTKPIKGPARPFEPAREQALRAPDSDVQRGTSQSQEFFRQLHQQRTPSKSPLKGADLVRFHPFLSVKTMHPRPDTAITDFSVATVGSRDSLQPQSPIRFRRGSTLRRVEGVLGNYAIETPDNGSKHSRLTAILQEDRDKHLPLICVTQFLSRQAAQLDTRPILVNDTRSYTFPVRYDTSPPEASRASPIVTWECESSEAKQLVLGTLMQARSVSCGDGTHSLVNSGTAPVAQEGGGSGLPTRTQAARRTASRSPPTRAERSAGVLAMFPDRSGLSPSRHLEQVHAEPDRGNEEHANPRFLSLVSFAHNPEKYTPASLSCSLSTSQAAGRGSRDTNRVSRGSDCSSFLATPAITNNVWEQSFWEDNASGLRIDHLTDNDHPVPCEAGMNPRLHPRLRSFRKNKLPVFQHHDRQRYFTAPTTLCPEDGEFSISLPSWGHRRDMTSASTAGLGLSPDPCNSMPTEEQLHELSTPLRQQSLSRRTLPGSTLPDLHESAEFPSLPISSQSATPLHSTDEHSVEENAVASQPETPTVLQLFQAHKLTRHQYVGDDLNNLESPREKRNQYVAREVKAPSIFTGRSSSTKVYSSYRDKSSAAATPTLPRLCRSEEKLPGLPMSRQVRRLPVSRQGRVRSVIDRNTKLFDRIRLQYPSISLPETASKLASVWTKKQYGDLGCFWGISDSH